MILRNPSSASWRSSGSSTGHWNWRPRASSARISRWVLHFFRAREHFFSERTASNGCFQRLNWKNRKRLAPKKSEKDQVGAPPAQSKVAKFLRAGDRVATKREKCSAMGEKMWHSWKNQERLHLAMSENISSFFFRQEHPLKRRTRPSSRCGHGCSGVSGFFQGWAEGGSTSTRGGAAKTYFFFCKNDSYDWLIDFEKKLELEKWKFLRKFRNFGRKWALSYVKSRFPL